MTEATNKTSRLVAMLREQAGEISNAGHFGWGNTMLAAADALEAPPAAAVVVPDLLEQCPKCPEGQNSDESYASGWNECLKYLQDLARLNPAQREGGA